MNAIPVIRADRLGTPEGLAALDDACRHWGFFQVTGHGIDPAVFEELLFEARRFFALPSAAKRALSRTADNPWGYFDRELTKNTRDWKQIYDVGPGNGRSERPQWPPQRAAFRAAVMAYYRACEQLGLTLLAALSRNLGMPEQHLAQHFQPRHSSFLRLNYYPVCPEPATDGGLAVPARGHLGVNHHTDAGALTLLLQDAQPGLEVYRRGAWHSVAPRADALVVNIGDIVQVWSNDRYPAALHRVRTNASAERFSAPFFFNPEYATSYAPLPSVTDEAHPPRYRPIRWSEFRRLRAGGDYADCGEEIQIHHYRV